MNFEPVFGILHWKMWVESAEVIRNANIKSNLHSNQTFSTINNLMFQIQNNIIFYGV